MHAIISQISPAIKHVLNGFDRIVFKGFFQSFMMEENVAGFLGRKNVLNKDFKPWVQEQTQIIVQKADDLAVEHTGQHIL